MTAPPLSQLLALAVLAACAIAARAGNVIFLHPDGASAAHWIGLRFLDHGPEGETEWDKLPRMAIYDGRNSDNLSSTSHAGATIHAYGVRVANESYGTDEGRPIQSLSGFDGSLAHEAIAAGKAVGVVNSATIAEPGTGAFLARITDRNDALTIALQIAESGAHVILGGGERNFLPTGVKGRHGVGRRTDGRNLVEELRARGYAIVHDRDELAALPADTRRVLGLFATEDTFTTRTEEQLLRENRSAYAPDAPTVGEMVRAALAVLARHEAGFLLVMNEEGSDNFGNVANAAGTFEALRRSDAAVGAARRFIAGRNDTLLVVASDSNSGGPHLLGRNLRSSPIANLPATFENSGQVDGRDGTESPPFLSAPDRQGRRFPFAVIWPSRYDGSGGLLARAEGKYADRLGLNVTNVGIYRLMYLGLFDRELQEP